MSTVADTVPPGECGTSNGQGVLLENNAVASGTTVYRAFVSEPGVMLFGCLSCTTLS